MRQGVQSGMGRRERMKHGSGMKDRDERSRGIEILIGHAFVMIKPTEPFRLAKQQSDGHETDPIPPEIY